MLIDKSSKKNGKTWVEDKTSARIKLDNMDPNYVFSMLLQRLIHEGEFNKAEDLLFEELDKNNSPQMYKVAEDFYNSLLEIPDKDLSQGNFSKEEIYQGLEDIKKYK